MAENYVNRLEFDSLKDEVKEIKASMKANSTLLQDIDKKVDIIAEKVTNANTVEELKIKPLKEEVDKQDKKIEKLEANQLWLWRTTIAAIIGIILNAIF